MSLIKKYSLTVVAVLVLGGVFVPAAHASSGLTEPQIQAIVGLLQAFGADASVVANVQAALHGGSSQVTGSITITSPQPPVLTFGATPSELRLGQSTTLFWKTSNASACVLRINGVEQSVGINATLVTTPTQTTLYKMICTNGSTDQASASTTEKLIKVNVSQ